MDPFEKLTDLFDSINLSNLYETLIKFNISMTTFVYMIFLLLILSTGIIVLIYLKIFSEMEYYLCLLNEDISIIINTIIYMCVFTIIILNGSFMIHKIPEYENYLKHQLNKTSYTVTKLSYDKKTALTSKNKQIEIQNSKIKTIKEPTKNKNKVGKIYYTVNIYEPNNVKKLLNNDKYQNQLIKHVYITKYQNLPTITQ